MIIILEQNKHYFYKLSLIYKKYFLFYKYFFFNILHGA